ncbi:MAG: hypothetical protein ABSB41_18390 [Anaerolineales bacterium]|jgi:hypothetical protein
MENSTRAGEIPELIQTLVGLLEANRGVFQQERPYWRAVGLVLGELFNFGRQTVTQEQMAMGMVDTDWSAWYRLFSRERDAVLLCLNINRTYTVMPSL